MKISRKTVQKIICYSFLSTRSYKLYEINILWFRLDISIKKGRKKNQKVIAVVCKSMANVLFINILYQSLYFYNF